MDASVVYERAMDLEQQMAEVFAERVRARRIAMGITQVELAERLDITRSAVCKIESGVTKSSQFYYIARLCIALDVSPTYFFRGISKKDKD